MCLSGLIISCEPDKKSATTKPQPGGVVENYLPNPSTLGKRPTPNPAPSLDNRMQYVVNKYWWYEGYVSSRTATTAARRGHWYYYYPDGVFIYGKFDKELGYGTWKYVTTNGGETLYNRSEDGTETMQWETMMSNTNDKLVLMGPPIGPNKGDQGMLQPYLQKPTEKDLFWAQPKIETKIVEEDALNQ